VLCAPLPWLGNYLGQASLRQRPDSEAKPIAERCSRSRAPRNESAKRLWIPPFEIRDGLRGYDPTGAVK
jgi:hypothetical protein